MLTLSVAAWATPEDDAINFVQETKLGNNLAPMAVRIAITSESYQAIVADLGEEEAQKLVGKHLKSSVESHQAEWNKNLASSYLEFFSAEELNSLLSEKAESPHFAKFKGQQLDVGTSMQKKSTDLLEKVVDEAMQAATAEVKPLNN